MVEVTNLFLMFFFFNVFNVCATFNKTKDKKWIMNEWIIHRKDIRFLFIYISLILHWHVSKADPLWTQTNKPLVQEMYLQQQNHVGLGQLLAVESAHSQTHHCHVAHGGMSVGDTGQDLTDRETWGTRKHLPVHSGGSGVGVFFHMKDIKFIECVYISVALVQKCIEIVTGRHRQLIYIFSYQWRHQAAYSWTCSCLDAHLLEQLCTHSQTPQQSLGVVLGGK